MTYKYISCLKKLKKYFPFFFDFRCISTRFYCTYLTGCIDSNFDGWHSALALFTFYQLAVILLRPLICFSSVSPRRIFLRPFSYFTKSFELSAIKLRNIWGAKLVSFIKWILTILTVFHPVELPLSVKIWLALILMRILLTEMKSIHLVL